MAAEIPMLAQARSGTVLVVFFCSLVFGGDYPALPTVAQDSAHG